MKNTLRNIIAGALIPLAVASSAVLPGCSRKKEAPEKSWFQKPEQKPYTVEDLVDKIYVGIGTSSTFELKHVGNGVYKGRDNRLIGSKVVEVHYNLKDNKNYAQIKIEGSLFNPEKNYEGSIDRYSQEGIYHLEGKNGEKLKLTIKRLSYHKSNRWLDIDFDFGRSSPPR